MKIGVWVLVFAAFSVGSIGSQTSHKRVALCAAIAAAQSENRITVSGTVTDASGAVIPGAQISIKLAGCTCQQCKPPLDKDCECCSNQVFSGGQDGSFRFSAIPGTYEIDVTARGLRGSASVEVSPGASNSVHITVQ